MRFSRDLICKAQACNVHLWKGNANGSADPGTAVMRIRSLQSITFKHLAVALVQFGANQIVVLVWICLVGFFYPSKSDSQE